MKKPLLCLVGPTASGKTDTALILAKKINAEIISCDSMQVYRGIDIASSKPTKTQREKVPHHLLDVVSVSSDYSAARFRRDAKKVIRDIHRRKKLPLIVAGTGLYLRALLDGLFEGPGEDPALRKKLNQLAQAHGSAYCHKRLMRCDRKAANAIHPHDLRRIIRALEVYELTGKPISELRKNTHGIREDYQVHLFGLRRQRDELYERIDARVEKMFRAGIVGEMKKISAKRFSKTAKVLLGYKEVKGFIDKEYDKCEAKRLLKLHTRRYAKRQLTWFRKEEGLDWIEVKKNDTPLKISKKIIELLPKGIKGL